MCVGEREGVCVRERYCVKEVVTGEGREREIENYVQEVVRGEREIENYVQEVVRGEREIENYVQEVLRGERERW